MQISRFSRSLTALRILILKPSSLGDVVQALPVLRLLKQHFPQSQIYWWIDSSLAPLLDEDSDLTGIIRFERRRWAAPWNWDEALESIFAARRLKFDWIIDLQCLARSGAFSWLANGGLTIGLDDAREGARGFYDLIIPNPANGVHAVNRYLNVLRTLEVPVHDRFTWLPDRPGMRAALELKWNLNSARWFVISPGARWETKRWPAENFAEVLRRLAAEFPTHKFAVIGSESETSIAQTVAEAVPGRTLNLAGRTALPELIEWIRAGDLMITNDTGPMHIAAALAKPVVAIFGPTDPLRTGPYGQIEGALQVPLPCGPCRKDTCANAEDLECLRAISPQQVVDEVQRRMR